jgi:very-short-patch-repair endonuclease
VLAAITDLASGQYGLFSRAQALCRGATQDMLDNALGAGRVTHEAAGVYGMPGWPESWYRRLWRAYLATGPHAVVSFETAATMHHLTNFPRGRIVLTTPHGDHHWHGLCELRQRTDIADDHIVVVGGLPVTSVVRTLFDLAAVTGAGRLAVAIEDAHIVGQCRLEELQAFFDELRRPGKRGMRKLGRILSERGPGYVPSQSWLQRRMVNVLLDGGLRKPQLEVQLPWRIERESRTDGLYLPERVLLEADGRRWHVRVDQMAEDRRRDREAQNHGYRPYRFVYQELRYDPQMVVETVREALAA